MIWVVYALEFLGSLLMVYNIYCFVKFVRYIQKLKSWNRKSGILYIPVILLVCFLVGYLAVTIFGAPDPVVASILFGGSVFVYTMYRLLSNIVQQILESEQRETELLAAEKSSRMKTKFLASMSHEMRTPMNVIIGQDEILLKDESIHGQARDRLEKIDISAHHLLDLINDVLNMNYTDSEESELKHETFSMGKVLHLVNLLAQTSCDEKGILYRSETAGQVDQTCIGDSMQLRQILVHVLGNAIKFTPGSGSVIFRTEQIQETAHRSLFRFTVSDTGIGIKKEFLPHVFDAFSQEDAGTTNEHGGSGLGLALARKLTGLMGGTITVESEKGKGSTFVISLPFETLSDADEKKEKGPAEVQLAGRHILIVEDMDMNAELVADLLDMEEMTSERAENGKQAVEMVSKSEPGHFDAVLMDLRMPVMDGFQAAHEIRSLDRVDAKTLPIIALTANSSQEDIQHSLEAGMNVHLSKPADSDLLYGTLRKLLAGK